MADSDYGPGSAPAIARDAAHWIQLMHRGGKGSLMQARRSPVQEQVDTMLDATLPRPITGGGTE